MSLWTHNIWKLEQNLQGFFSSEYPGHVDITGGISQTSLTPKSFLMQHLKELSFVKHSEKCHSKAMAHRTATFLTEIIMLRGPYLENCWWIRRQARMDRELNAWCLVRKSRALQFNLGGTDTILFPLDLRSGSQTVRSLPLLLEPHTVQMSMWRPDVLTSLSSPPWNLTSVPTTL